MSSDQKEAKVEDYIDDINPTPVLNSGDADVVATTVAAINVDNSNLNNNNNDNNTATDDINNSNTVINNTADHAKYKIQSREYVNSNVNVSNNGNSNSNSSNIHGKKYFDRICLDYDTILKQREEKIKAYFRAEFSKCVNPPSDSIIAKITPKHVLNLGRPIKWATLSEIYNEELKTKQANWDRKRSDFQHSWGVVHNALSDSLDYKHIANASYPSTSTPRLPQSQLQFQQQAQAQKTFLTNDQIKYNPAMLEDYSIEDLKKQILFSKQQFQIEEKKLLNDYNTDLNDFLKIWENFRQVWHAHEEIANNKISELRQLEQQQLDRLRLEYQEAKRWLQQQPKQMSRDIKIIIQHGANYNETITHRIEAKGSIRSFVNNILSRINGLTQDQKLATRIYFSNGYPIDQALSWKYYNINEQDTVQIIIPETF